MKKAIFIVLLCVSLGCVSTHTTVLNPSLKRKIVTPDQVVIYMSADKVPGKYEEMAVLTSQGAYTVAGDDKFYESFRKEAAKIGANGVILSTIEDPSTGQKVGSAVLSAFLIPNTMANRKTQATAIWVTTPAEEAAADAAKIRDSANKVKWAAQVDSLDALVHIGMMRAEMFDVVGPPNASEAEVTKNGQVETATYIGSTGKTFIVTLLKNVVSQVVAK